MTRRKKILILLLTLFGGGGLLLLLLGVLVYKFFAAPFGSKEPPPELREARVLGGAELLTKSVFYRADQRGSWRDWLDREKLLARLESNHDLAVGQLDGRPGLDVALARSYGLTVLDREGRIKERVNYQFETGTAKLGPLESERVKDGFRFQRVLDVEGDGVCEVLGYGGLDGMAVFNHQGRVVLSRGAYTEGKLSVQDVAAGDVNGDGALEFVVAWGYEPAGVELLDRFGNSLWRQGERFTPGPFEVADVDGDGKREIVEDDGDKLKIRDAQGKQLRTVKTPVYLWHLSLCPVADGGGPPQNLAVRDGSVWLMNLGDEKFTRLDAPLSKVQLPNPRVTKYPGIEETFVEDKDEVYRAAGAWVRLKKDQPKYLAVVGEFILLDRSMFYVYDSQGKLVYHEVLPEECKDLVALPTEEAGDGAEEILVGGETTVWRYAAR